MVGVTATLAPTLLARVVGLPAAETGGSAGLAWRWFGIRTAAVATAALAGHTPARAAIALLQVPDQIVMLHAWRSGSVGRRPALTSLAVSWFLVVSSGIGCVPCTRRPRVTGR